MEIDLTMKAEAEFAGATVVLVGDLNPAIFQPAWLAANSLINQAEADNAEVEVIHPEVSVFSADWLRIRVEKNRFLAETVEQPYIRLSDFVLNTFGKYLPQTPLRQLGVNFAAHIFIPSLYK